MGRRNRERVARIRAGLEEPRVSSSEERKEQREVIREKKKQLLWGMRKLLVRLQNKKEEK